MSDVASTAVDPGATVVIDPPDAQTSPFQAEANSGVRPGERETLLDALELPIEVRLGRRLLPLERALALRVGDAVPVGPEEDDAVTLYVQGRPYAHGDLVVVDGRFAFRVRDLVDGHRPGTEVG